MEDYDYHDYDDEDDDDDEHLFYLKFRYISNNYLNKVYRRKI